MGPGWDPEQRRWGQTEEIWVNTDSTESHSTDIGPLVVQLTLLTSGVATGEQGRCRGRSALPTHRPWESESTNTERSRPSFPAFRVADSHGPALTHQRFPGARVVAVGLLWNMPPNPRGGARSHPAQSVLLFGMNLSVRVTGTHIRSHEGPTGTVRRKGHGTDVYLGITV